jgi:tetratricopeptide (TPR) repeat protein
MPWKTEIDRLVNRSLHDAAKGGEKETERALKTVGDLLDLAPERVESHFHIGVAAELLGDGAEALPDSIGESIRWRHLGALDAASRRGDRDRVHELVEDESFEESLTHPEGRMALRAVGRMLLREGRDVQVFDFYAKHLAAVEDEGSQRDAEFLLEEALRRADRYERGERNEEEALARLDRAAAFVESAGLEPRAGAKVDRKMGRVHQLGERWEDAVICYRRALEHLPEDDPYRSVLVGDLALATLGVRGTLDLLPMEEREGRDEAREILVNESDKCEGRSYNAIYTLGMLHYESGDFEAAAASFREADQLMRENRAKARIVHARSRFFLGHCLLALGAEGEELEYAQSCIERDAGPSNLDAEVKEPIFDVLREQVPDAGTGSSSRRGRRSRGRGRGRGRDRDDEQDDDVDAPEAGKAEKTPLEEAIACVSEDPMKALQLVDQVFKSRPDFDTWFGAYRMRLAALVGLNEREEALRTYDRFRAKLYQRDTFDRIEGLLIDTTGPMADLLDDQAFNRELVDLYEVMPDRETQFVEHCIAYATGALASGEPEDIASAVHMLQAAAEHDAAGVKALLTKAEKAAKKAGLDLSSVSADEMKETLAGLDEEIHILVVGGDEGRKPHLASFQDLQKRLGFEGSWVFTGSRPPRKTIEEIEDEAQETSAILLHHRADPAVREEVRRMAAEMQIPLREVSWMGLPGVSDEVLRTVQECLAEE